MSVLRTLGLVAFLLFIAWMVSGCATITRGTKDALTVETEPQGARCETSNGFFCSATPCAIKMPRKSEGTVTCSLPGYEDGSATFTHKTAGGGAAGMAGNILLGGIIGAGVDAGSGATQEITPNPISIKLVEQTTGGDN